MDKDDPDKGKDEKGTSKEQSTPPDITETYHADTTQWWPASSARRGVPGKGNTAAKRYRGVTPRQRDERDMVVHEPVKADPARNARIEADMALAMGILPAPQPAEPVNGDKAGLAALQVTSEPQATPVQAKPGPAGATSSAPATQAGPGQRVAFNAYMTVSCWRGSERLSTWSGPSRWNGDLPARFRAQVNRGRLHWQGSAPDKNTLRVDTDTEGQGGKSLEQWMPRRTTLIVVNLVASAQATGAGDIAGTGGEEAGNKPSAPPRGAQPTEQRGEAHAKHAPIDIDALDLDSPLGGLTHDPLADSDTGADTGRDAPGAGRSERAPLDAAGSGQADKPTGVNGPGGDKGALEGGGEFAKPGGVTAEKGGVDGEFARITGEAFGADHGAIAGEGARDDFGMRGGGGVIGVVNVPASLRPLAETLNILEDANPGKLAGSWLRKGLERLTVRRIRKKLRSEASEYAAKRINRLIPKINRNKAFQRLPRQQRERFMQRMEWDFQRGYFGKVEDGARKEVSRLKAKIRRARTRRAERAAKKELQKAEKLLEAAKVKPLAGDLPRNHEYAGKALPSRKLPRGYKTKGLRFTEDGYPDFAPHAAKLPNGKTSVKIELTGNRRLDERLANKAAGIHGSKAPSGYTWHHYQDGTTMQLVPKDLHKAVRHTGGRAHYRHRIGDLNTYKD